MNNTTQGMLSLILLSLCACQGEVSNQSLAPTPSTDIPKELLDPLATPEGLREHARSEEIERGGVVAPDHARLRRRLDIDQLDASIRRVSGGIEWTEIRGGKEINSFTKLSKTLGKPDYRETTREDLSPSIIFQKFLGDAARSVCTKIMERDTDETSEAPRSILLHISTAQSPTEAPEAARDNLKALLLKFHGRMITEDTDPRIGHWQQLLNDSFMASQDARVAWTTVCVGLMTHPDFYMY